VTDSLAVVKGTLDVLVLRALTGTPMHSFEVVGWLEQNSRGTLEIDDKAVYQALHRMEERGLISAQWGLTENNRRARYYRPTAAGRSHLKAETTRWLRYADTVSGMLTGATKHA
jgi:PadR family transcriptional regulator PadR